jgi:hypothetical protein
VIVSFGSRIFAVVDVRDALKLDRPYRTGWAEEKVREHICGLSENTCRRKASEKTWWWAKGKLPTIFILLHKINPCQFQSKIVHLNI